MGNHYHALIYIPKADAMPQAKALRRWQEAELAVNRPVRDDPSEKTLEAHRQRIRDISFIAGNFQQQFTQWHNKRNDHWGKLFGGRFNSVLLDEQGAVARVMAYITLNAVRAQLVDDPAEYRWSGYAKRIATGKLRDNDRTIAGVPATGVRDGGWHAAGLRHRVLGRVWKRFRERLLGSRVKRGDLSTETLAELLNASISHWIWIGPSD